MKKKLVFKIGIVILLLGGLFCIIYNPIEDYYEEIGSNLKFKNTLYVVYQEQTIPEDKFVRGKRIGKTSDGIIYEVQGYPNHAYIILQGTADMTEPIIFKKVNN